jgi:antitoxin VapB
MATGTVFINNRTQAVRLPSELRFPEGVKRVTVRKVGRDRVLSPIGETWDTFFAPDSALVVTEDFMTSRATQTQSPREVF